MPGARSTQPDCFVVMPYGMKTDLAGTQIDFDAVYRGLIEKAVEQAGLRSVRCDEDPRAGLIVTQMLTHLLRARLALVDLTTLNANVFYELGVRHALRPSGTVLIKRAGSPQPFNIEGLRTVEYGGPKTDADSVDDIAAALQVALDDPNHCDSLVYEVLDDLKPPQRPARGITRFQQLRHPLAQLPGKSIVLVTGDREDITVGDIWVTSENTDMEMDAYYGRSTSATLRWLGARKDAGGRVVEDTLGIALAQAVGARPVAPATVIVTGAGELTASNGVQHVFHVAAVEGQPRQGYRPVSALHRCVKNALQKAAPLPCGSILFPVFGTGPGGGDFEDHARICFEAAIEFLEARPDHPVEQVMFYVWSEADLETAQAVLRSLPGVAAT